MSDLSPRGSRRAAARRRVKEAVAGRIRVGVAIVAGGAFGALVVLWGGLGPDSGGRGETRSADASQCEAPADCVPPTSLTPLPASAPGSVGVTRTPTRPRPSSTSRARRPLTPVAAVSAENSAATATPTQALPTSTPAVEPTPSAGAPGDPFSVDVDIPPITLPTCILVC